MKKSTYILFLVVLFMAINHIKALANNNQYATQKIFQDRIYHSYISGQILNWERTLNELEVFYQQNSDASILYDLLLARYGFIAMCLGEDEKRNARIHLDKAEKELEELFRHPGYKSQSYALQGAFLGFRISLRPLSAIRLGPRSYSAIDKAVESDPNNPVAWMEMGNSRFYTPSTFGGSKEEALKHYRKAVNLFEANLPNNHRWLYLNALVGMAKSYQYMDQPWLAVATYESALRYEPDFKWVKDELLPQARKILQ